MAVATFSGQSANEVLERLAVADLAAGCVNIIDIGAIREHSLARWDRRREQVGDFIALHFRKRARDSDLILPLNETQFVAIQPGIPKALAVACCGHIARDTLTYFLGADSQVPLRLMVVSAVNGGAIETIALDEAAVRAAMNSSNDPATSQDHKPLGWADSQTQSKRASRIVVEISPRVEAILGLEPIWSVQQSAVVSFLTSSAIFGERDGGRVVMQAGELNVQQKLALALKMIDYASDNLAAAEASGSRFRIHLPIAVDVLTRSRERLQLASRLQRLSASERQMIVVELDACEIGMPHSRMLELVSVVKPYFRSIVVRISEGLPCPKIWRDCGISGVAIVADGSEGLTDRHLMRKLKSFAEAAAGPRTFIVGHGFRRRGWVMAAWAEGFTHVSGQVIADEAQISGCAIRLSASDIFARSA